MAPFLIERADRMAQMFPAPGIDRPLLKAYPVDTTVVEVAARRVLAKSFGLDNVTPNGTVMPRERNQRHLDVFRGAVLAELDHMDGHISHVADPVLRVSRYWQPERPYAVGKMHSDVWRGEPRHSMIVLLPLWGCENSKVVFREPMADTFTPIADYDLGDTAGTDYDVPFEPGFVYYCDAFCLHQTVKLREGERVSADLRATFKNQLASDDSPWQSASEFKPVQSIEAIY